MDFSVAVPRHAARVITLLEQVGFEAWVVGGCVRDSLLGRTPLDWDVTTSATPTEVLAALQGIRVVPTGIQHGTVTAVLEEGNIEITTYRADGAYTDHRRPDSVRFSRVLKDDLARRDFTVNAMAYHPSRGLIDAFGGLADLKRCSLRAVGDPTRRFNEDALRILRCVRFAAVLGFEIEPETAKAAAALRALLKDISRERIGDELTKLLCGENAAEVLRNYAEIIFTAVPELAPMAECAQETPFHCYNAWEHTLHTLEAVKPDPIVRWAALLHDCGKPETKSFDEKGIAHFYGHSSRSEALSREILEGLRFSRRECDEICQLVAMHMELLPPTEKRLKRLLGKLGEEQLFRLLELIRGDWAGLSPTFLPERSPALEETLERAKALLESSSALTLKDLAVNGRDLMELGFVPSPALGQALETLLDEVLEGKLENTKEALLERAARARAGQDAP